MGYCEKSKSYAQQKVKLLLEEGAKVKCEDEKDVNIEEVATLPEWYDEEKFKRGQQFFHENIWGLLLSKFLGLIIILSIKSILNILIHTRMSGTPMSAFKRYIQTIFHMYVWYDKDFKPGSRLWKSLSEVRNKHSSASRRGCKAGFDGVTQKDMALTQFGFMGFVMVKPEMVGIFRAKEEDLEAFTHVWRVVGHLLGMEDRFNICSGSLKETQETCKELVDQVFVPAIQNIDKDFVFMVRAMIDGLWSLNPYLEYEAFMIYLHKICGINRSSNNNREAAIVPTKFTKFALWLASWELYLYQFYIVKLYLNYMEYLSLWLIKNFPFLAFYQFGYKNSFVTILNGKNAYNES